MREWQAETAEVVSSLAPRLDIDSLFSGSGPTLSSQMIGICRGQCVERVLQAALRGLATVPKVKHQQYLEHQMRTGWGGALPMFLQHCFWTLQSTVFGKLCCGAPMVLGLKGG